ncbi:MAG: hypothetical protein O7D96_02385, partial [SAR324 cluster bacterium]|nr:hypothetical protein [SAR324 cluster bacterium]
RVTGVAGQSVLFDAVGFPLEIGTTTGPNTAAIEFDGSIDEVRISQTIRYTPAGFDVTQPPFDAEFTAD